MFGQVSRDIQLEAILAQIYVLSFGEEVGEDYALETEVSRRLGIDRDTVEKRVRFLVLDKKLLEWIGGGGAELVPRGVIHVENAVRDWVGLGKRKTPLSDLYESCLEILVPREWQRFQLLRCLEDLSDGEPTEYVDYDDLRDCVGLEREPFHKTLDHLIAVGSINMPEGSSFRIAEAGLSRYRTIEDRFELLGLTSDLAIEEFGEAIQKVWTGKVEARTRVVDFVHSDDYSYVRKGDREFSLPGRPAKVIGLLHRAYKSEQPVVTKEVILSVLGYPSNRKVRDVFKPDHLDAWRELVRFDGQGRYRLRLQ